MTDRIPLDDLTSDQLDALYDERDAARERLDFHERSTLPDLHRRAESDAATIKRWRDRAEAAEAALECVRVWADGPCPTRPKGYEITGDRASGYVQAMDEIAQLLAGHGPIAALDPAQQPTA